MLAPPDPSPTSQKPVGPGTYPDGFFPGGSLAYIIGINDYLNFNKLKSPLNDCAGLQDVLARKHGFKKIVKKENATKQDVTDLLAQMTDECKKDSRVIFYYAGHGIAQGSDDDKGLPKGYLLASDSERDKPDTYIEMNKVLETLKGLPCQHLLIILDCCYAGAIRFAEQTRGFVPGATKILYKEKFKYYAENPTIQVITSAACDQRAVDALGERGHNPNGRSPFADSLIDNLENGDEGWSLGHAQPDGIVTASELGFFLTEETSNRLSENKIPIDQQQTPTVFRIGEKMHGEFMFINKQDAILDLAERPRQNPYLGLSAYSFKDKNLFYGRQRAIDGWWDNDGQYHKGLMEIVVPTENQADRPYRIVITGPSGIGKSSLIKAGILAQLPDIPFNVITPSVTPVDEQNKIIEKVSKNDILQYLLIDQYEQIVTVFKSEKERIDFENKLTAIAINKKAVVIITLRSDQDRNFVNSPFIGEAQLAAVCRFDVPAFTRDEIKEIVLQPADQQMLKFKGIFPNPNTKPRSQDDANQRFTDKMVNDVFINPASLPILSQILSTLYQKKDPDSDFLLEEDYDKAGGVTGTLDQRLTDIYNACDVFGKALLRQFIYRMTSFEEAYLAEKKVHTAYTQDNKTISELEFSDDKTTAAINDLKDKLIENRLITAACEEADGGGNRGDSEQNSYVIPVHEDLIRSSKLVAQWKDEKHDGDLSLQAIILLLNSVAQSARLYYFYDDKSKKGALWNNDPRLSLAKTLWDKKIILFNKTEENFIVRSLNAKARARKIFQALAASIFIAVTIALVIITILEINVNKEKAIQQNQLALSYWEQGRNAKDVNDPLALLYAAEALNVSLDTNKRQEILFNADKTIPPIVLSDIISLSSPLLAADVSADGKLALTVNDSTLRVWNLVTSKEIRMPKTSGVAYAAFTADGTQILTSEKKNLVERDTTGKMEILVRKPPTEVLDGNAQFLQLSADGSILTAAYQRTVFTWQLIAGKWVFKKQVGQNQRIDISKFRVGPDGSRLLMADKYNNVQLFNAFTGKPYLKDIPQSVTAWTANTDLTKIFFAFRDGSSKLVDINGKGNTFKNTTKSLFTIALFMKDGTLLLGNGSKVAFYDLTGNKVSGDIDFDAENAPTGLSLTADGGHVLAHSRSLKKIYLVKATENNRDTLTQTGDLYVPGQSDPAYTLLSRDGRTIAQMTNSSLRIYRNLEKKKYYLNGTEIQGAGLFSNDAKTAVTVQTPLDGGMCSMWQLEAGEVKQLYNAFKLPLNASMNIVNNNGTLVYSTPQQSPSTALNFSLHDFTNGKDVLLGNTTILKNSFSLNEEKVTYTLPDGTLHVRRAPDWRDEVIFKDTCFSKGGTACFLGNAGIILTVDSNLTLKTITPGKNQKPVALNITGDHLRVDTDPNGLWLLAYSEDRNGGSKFFNLRNGNTFDNLGGLQHDTYAVSPDGTRIFVYGTAGDYYFYNFNEKKKLQLPVNTADIRKAQFSADNRLLLVSFDKYAMVLDLETMQWKSREITGSIQNELMFSPDAKKIIQVDASSKSIYIYDAFTAGRLARVTYADKNNTYFSPDARTIYIWEHGQIRIFYQDLDISAALFKLQANVLTGGSLNLTTGEIEEIPASKWKELKQQYDLLGGQHYKYCHYKTLNTWYRVHPAN